MNALRRCDIIHGQCLRVYTLAHSGRRQCGALCRVSSLHVCGVVLRHVRPQIPHHRKSVRPSALHEHALPCAPHGVGSPRTLYHVGRFVRFQSPLRVPDHSHDVIWQFDVEAAAVVFFEQICSNECTKSMRWNTWKKPSSLRLNEAGAWAFVYFFCAPSWPTWPLWAHSPRPRHGGTRSPPCCEFTDGAQLSWQNVCGAPSDRRRTWSFLWLAAAAASCEGSWSRCGCPKLPGWSAMRGGLRDRRGRRKANG